MGEKKAEFERQDEIVTYFPPIHRSALGSILFETIIGGENQECSFLAYCYIVRHTSSREFQVRSVPDPNVKAQIQISRHCDGRIWSCMVSSGVNHIWRPSDRRRCRR